MAFMLGEQTSGIETRSLRTGTSYLKIQDGQDVDVLHVPTSVQVLTNSSLTERSRIRKLDAGLKKLSQGD